MVSGTCCPACGDQVKWVRESRAAVLKGQCPVGHGGEFPDVLKGSISGLRRLMEVIEDGYEVLRADFWPKKQI